MPLPSRGARDWEGVHTCHSECPCQTGGKPTPDFLPVEDAALGLAELEFDARVALPEAQERFKRAETENRRLREALGQVVAAYGMSSVRSRAADKMAEIAREALSA